MSRYAISTTVNNDAQIVLDVRSTSALNAGTAVVELSPTEARSHAIRLLQLADEADVKALRS